MAKLILHKGQSDVVKHLFPQVGVKAVRYAPVVASRGFGKSYGAAAGALMGVNECLRMPISTPNKNLSIIAPTFDQVTDIYWPLLAHSMGLERLAVKSSRDLGRFWFKNGTQLRLWSYEAIERMRGTGQFFTALDEVTSWKGKPGLQDAWESIIHPAMVTRWPENHRGLIISTPKGYDYFYDMTNMQEKDDRWKTFHYSYKDSPYLSIEEIQRIKANTDPLKFAREYDASFKESGSGVFYMFNRDEHVTRNLADFQPGEDIHACIDFNVGLQATSIFALRSNQMQFLAEMQGHPDTDSLAKRIKTTYIDKGHKVYAYPDPSGNSRKTSAPVGQTDFSILEAHGINIRVKGQVPLVDSANAVNRMLMNGNGDINMFFHTDKVPNTIKSIERTVWVEGKPESATIDKSQGVEHWSDGIRYAAQFLFPIQRFQFKSGQGFMF